MLAYNADLYSDETIEHFKDCFLGTVIPVATTPEELFFSVLIDNNTTAKQPTVIIDDIEL